ncbi:ACT domain-containing protein [Polyangium sp. 6x1]|uniref:glycine cleavage system protein R n=1 Tax=Polyangium sp. 6x1 TaxID=3042689 RepID=UPI0024825C06|nr:ACT domain-containing protein [Polyangium sp. 6x1]MDI1452152.1 ACT domain-containing protein [Polyangium sp. 6x1]
MTQQDVYVVLSCLGPDRPGLVAEVTEYLTKHGGNVEDSRMAILGAEFGILLLASGPPATVDAIEKDLGDLQKSTGLSVVARRTKAPEEHRRAPTIPCAVTAEALDHEGIVRAVARALAHAGVNIVSLEATAYAAPVTGSQLFRMEARIDVPQSVGVSKVRKAMDVVAEEQNLEIEVRSLIKS